MIPPTVRHGIPLFEREWREDLQPRYRAAIAAAARSVEVTPPSQLPMLVDELADFAGEYFASVAALSGAAYKMEMNLAIFYRRHIAKTVGGSHLALVAGFDIPSGTAHPAIASMDWWFEPTPSPSAPLAPAPDHRRVREARLKAEGAAVEALAASPRRLREFRKLLADTQRLVPIREEQVAELTIAWPVMRRAVLRIGEELASRGVLDDRR